MTGRAHTAVVISVAALLILQIKSVHFVKYTFPTLPGVVVECPHVILIRSLTPC